MCPHIFLSLPQVDHQRAAERTVTPPHPTPRGQRQPLQPSGLLRFKVAQGWALFILWCHSVMFSLLRPVKKGIVCASVMLTDLFPGKDQKQVKRRKMFCRLTKWMSPAVHLESRQSVSFYSICLVAWEVAGAKLHQWSVGIEINIYVCCNHFSGENSWIQVIDQYVN